MHIKPIVLSAVFMTMTLSFPIFGQTKPQFQSIGSPKLERNKAYEKSKRESLNYRSLSENKKSYHGAGKVVTNPCFSNSKSKYKRK